MNVPNADLNGSPTVISTFAGCGGSSLGYQLAGFRELLAVEWDNNAVETFKLNFPDVPVFHGDIKKLSGERCMNMAGIVSGELDVLDGSPPCQGFSTAGKRKFDDPRNSLFNEYARLLEELQPRVFVMENVTGLVKGCMKQAYLKIVSELRRCGYQVVGKIMNAMYYSVPQSRQRVIIIGTRKDLPFSPTHPSPQSIPCSSGSAIKNLMDSGIALTPEAEKYWPMLKPGESASKYHPKGHLFGLIKLDPNKPSPTLTRSAGASKLVHWNERRAIGNKERAALSSFPESFRWTGSFGEIYDRIGNCVPPNLMKAIAEHIKTNILVPSKVGID